MNIKNLVKSRILLLGDKGFFGKNLKNYFLKNKYNFYVLPKNHNLHNFDKTYKFINKTKPSIIINCAGKVGGLHYNIAKPAEIFYCNIKILLNILEVGRLLKINKIINIGSSCSYPAKTKRLKLSEKILFTGKLHNSVEAYGFWKLSSIIGAKAYKKQYNINSLNIIFPSLYGPHDKFDELNSHVISSLIRKFIKAKINKKNIVKLWGSGSPTREFMFIEDAIEGLMTILMKYNSIEPINLGIGKGYKIRDIAQKIKKIIKYEGKIFWDKNKPNGSMNKILDISKQNKLIKWRPTVDIDTGLLLTVKWLLKDEKIDIY